MIILDTNVISEPMRPAPDLNVVAWLDAQPAETLFLTTITLAEVRFGIAALPEGRRQRSLVSRFEDEFVAAFDGRILSFDEPSSRHCADIRAAGRASGTAVHELDAMIAGIARHQQMSVASRDTAPFESAGLTVHNPFSA